MTLHCRDCRHWRPGPPAIHPMLGKCGNAGAISLHHPPMLGKCGNAGAISLHHPPATMSDGTMHQWGAEQACAYFEKGETHVHKSSDGRNRKAAV